MNAMIEEVSLLQTRTQQAKNELNVLFSTTVNISRKIVKDEAELESLHKTKATKLKLIDTMKNKTLDLIAERDKIEEQLENLRRENMDLEVALNK